MSFFCGKQKILNILIMCSDKCGQLNSFCDYLHPLYGEKNNNTVTKICDHKTTHKGQLLETEIYPMYHLKVRNKFNFH